MVKAIKTSDDWGLIEKQLRTYGSVKLHCDDDEVELLVSPTRKNWLQLVIIVLVNGKINMSEPENRYSMPRSRFVYTEKSRKAAEKLSKQHLKRLGIDPSKKVILHDPRWNSFMSMKQHFTKTCGKIFWEYQDAAK